MKTPSLSPKANSPLFRTPPAKFIRAIGVLAIAAGPLVSAPVAELPRGATYQEGELLVKWRGGPKGENARSATPLLQHEVKRDFEFIGWQQIRLPKGAAVHQALARYKSLPEVLAAEPNYQHASIQPALSSTAFPPNGNSTTVDDSFLAEQYALQRIGASHAWAVTNGSSNIVVAIIDTGINYRHEDLAPNMWRNPGETPGNGIDDDGNGYRDDVHGIDVVNDAFGNDADPNDEGFPFYHGTACAGVIGAVGKNGKGIAGVNSSIQLMAIRAGGTNGFLTSADIIEGLNYVVLMKQRGVNLRVVNMSFGGTNYSQAMKDGHDRVAAAGVLQVAAAGNEGQDNDSIPAYPASYNTSNLLSVAASDSMDSLATFSCYGRTNVDLAAPGVAVIMTGGPESNSYTVGSGTSFSAPYAVGAAALLLAAHPQLTAADLKRILLDSVDVLPAFENRMLSHGRLNVARALSHSSLVDGISPFLISEPRYSILPNSETPRRLTVAAGSAGSMSVSAGGSGPLYYQWRRAFTPGVFTGLPGATNPILTFASVNPADIGIYDVVVSNAFGSMTNERILLQVQSTIGFTRIVGDPLVMDSGALSGSWGDFDGDGYPDVFLPKLSSGSNSLFRNNGNGTFIKVTTGSIGTDRGDASGAAWADFDNDDDLDLFVPNGTNQQNLVYRNDGNGVFTKVSASALTLGGLSFNGAWADYDRDGWLDLFVSNGGFLEPKNNFLFHNDGDGTFSRVTVGSIVSDSGDSLGSSWSDFDQDGFPDLFVANFHSRQSFLYHNNAGQDFVGLTNSSAGRAPGRLFTSGSSSDYDNDLDSDLLVSAGGRSILYQNDGSGNLDGVSAGDLGQDNGFSLGAAWGDFDNDGFVDAFFSNSSMESRFFYQNNGDGTFTRIISDVFLSNGSGAGCEAVDYNNDGFLDLFVTGFAGGTNTLLRNRGNTNHWLTLTLRGTGSNRDAIGAKVKLRATIGGTNRWQMREISGSGGWGSRNAGRAAFGLGDATNVDLIRIEWPSGTVQELENVPASQFLTITEPGFRFVRQPLDLFLRPGANTNLTALAWSDGAITYQWMFNGAPLEGQTAPVLSITAAQWTQQGEYAVVANDGLRSVTSRVARVTLIIDPIIVQQPLSQPVLPGATVTLSVVVTNTATLPLTVRWRRNGVFLSSSETIHERSAFLTITNVQSPGNYSVLITNIGRSLNSATATLSFLADINSNGLPDTWEAHFGVTDPEGDADADGVDNRQEYRAGTNPTNSASVLRIDLLPPTGIQQQRILRFAAASNHTYSIECSSSLGIGSWVRLIDVAAVPTNRTVDVNVPSSEVMGARQFYRLVTPR